MHYGGPVKVCLEMCQALAQAGDQVTIYTTDMDYPTGRLPVTTNQAISQLGYSVWYFPVQFIPYVVAWRFAQAIKRNLAQFDLVHIHGLYRFPQAVTAYYARKYRIPYVITPHGSLDPFLFHQKRHRISKRIYEYVIEKPNLDHAGAIQYTTEDEMTLVKPLRLRAPGVIIPNGLDTQLYDDLPSYGSFRTRYGIDQDEIVILHFGRINFKKGLDILVNAFARSAQQHPNVRLVIAGPDNDGYQAQVQQWVREHGVVEKTLFTGMLDKAESLAVLTDADIFALPSYTENFGIAVIEAMMCKLPVVISDKVNIWREIKAHNVGIITACDAGEVSSAFNHLIEHPEQRTRLGTAGKAFVEQTYSWAPITAKLRAMYQNLIHADAQAATASAHPIGKD